MLLLVLLVVSNFSSKVTCEQLLRVINFEESKFNDDVLSYGELITELQRVRFYEIYSDS